MQSCGYFETDDRILVGVIWDNIDYPIPDEDPAIHWLKLQGNYRIEAIPMNNLFNSKNNWEVDVLWFHRSFDKKRQKVPPALDAPMRDYLSRGGNILLTMEAARISHDFGWQPVAPMDSVIILTDHGPGRNYGFHGDHRHPIYGEMEVDAYTWNPKEDHEEHRLGYFHGDRPDDSEIIGVQWSNTTFNEEEILVWEQSLEKGKVLHVGAFIYPSEDQFSEAQHDRFLHNILQYLAGERQEDLSASLLPPVQRGLASLREN
jgi:hypothetical protein